MATTIGKETEILDTLNNLIALDYDAIEAYQAAVERLDEPLHREQLTKFMGDHRRHTENVAQLVRSRGGTPATEGDMKALLAKGKVMLANLLGDKTILQAMKSNEDDTNTAYERASQRSDLSAADREVLSANLADERRHREWIKQRIAQL